MPSVRGIRPAIALHDVAFLRGSHLGGFARIEAESHHVKILAKLERQRLHRTDQALKQFGAQHRALIVAEVQYDRTPMAEVVAELYCVAEFVAKLEITRHLGVEVLLDADKLEPRWPLVGRRRQDSAHHGAAGALGI